jgi:hypothetical protein
MKARKTGVEIQRLHETRFAVVVDGLVRYVGTLEECQRRAAILTPEDTRAHPGPSAAELRPIRIKKAPPGSLAPFA